MKKTIVDYKLKGKRVIIRSDLNVPIEKGIITDDNRILQSVDTIKFALDCKAKVIVLSHLGRIKTEEDKKNNSLCPVSIRLSELLEQEVKFIPQTRGPEVIKAIDNMDEGKVIMLENTRFEDLDGNKESSNNDELSRYWASLGDIFINDAFATAHREHASNVGIASHLPNGVGLLLNKEIKMLKDTLENPKRPFIVILGGSKVEDKLDAVEHLVKIADRILIGGGMCFTFLKALGYSVGNSIVDDTKIEKCKEIYNKYKNQIVLPVDIMTGRAFTPDTTTRLANVDDIRQNEIGMDIGVQTINEFKKILMNANTIIWNGPLGVFEIDKFSIGTKKICEVIAKTRSKSVIAGGDTVAAIIKFRYKDEVSYISTGGGASLELLKGNELPGIASIQDK
jgi:phosphoglycerate kinase